MTRTDVILSSRRGEVGIHPDDLPLSELIVSKWASLEAERDERDRSASEGE